MYVPSTLSLALPVALPKVLSATHSYIPESTLLTSRSSNPVENTVNVSPTTELDSSVVTPRGSVWNQRVRGCGVPPGRQSRKMASPGARSESWGATAISGTARGRERRGGGGGGETSVGTP